MLKSRILLLSTVLSFVPAATAQSYLPMPLDPTRNLTLIAPPAHVQLPEQYLWTAGDVTVQRPDHNKFPWNRPELRIAPHVFRKHFQVDTPLQTATIYLAGPREAHVFLNGKRLADFSSNPDAPIGFQVFHADAASMLRPGDNVLAIEAIRGRGVVSASASPATEQLAYGEVLAVKLIPASFGVDAPPLVVSDSTWRSSPTLAAGWQETAFDDSAWPSVQSLGPVESNVDFFQWSADAGMYGWPGYLGMSPSLRTYALPAVAVTHVYTGLGHFGNLEALTRPSSQPFTVVVPPNLTDAESPQIVLDFGREVAGRLLVESASAETATLSIAYGESELEALATGLTSTQQGGHYLGTNLLQVPGNGIARGPKSGFRYVRIRFLRGMPLLAFKSIRLEGIYEPVVYGGSFESSDPLLNRIWETGAYTVHLCMQDGLWDAPKRDRGRWVGDIDVEGRVLATVFGDSTLLKDTLRRLAEGTPAGQHVNGIASYSALWITSLANLYQHDGDRAFLVSQHEAMLRILARMDRDVDESGKLRETMKGWGFVDWAPGLYGTTPETRMGTHLQYLRGYRAAVQLLAALGDVVNQAKYEARSDSVETATQSYLDPIDKTLGRTWQLNALVALTASEPGPRLWRDVLLQVKQDSPGDQSISPYFGAYVLDAMSSLGHHREALNWIRTYWGGMLAEGATSFWESYDLRWPKTNPHLSLQADGTSGFFVSLAHGWSAGPTAWMSENILGVTPATPGYEIVNFSPHLLGLQFARGSVPTPHGPITVSIERDKPIVIDLPPGIKAMHGHFVAPHPGAILYIDGTPHSCPGCGLGEGRYADIQGSGHHIFEFRQP